MSSAKTPPLACRPSPPQGGRSQAARPSPEWFSSLVGEIATLIGVGWRAQLISPLVGEMPGRAEGGVFRRASRARLPIC
ncbi:hypothetical protein FHP24_07205 [Aliirhizobium smilacinae]|uniref:Uncharacterized protein n=1 Tax=Aliirhizobium smilacinae TaxID=1395944 RepID=A0A5C4XVQ7_9HYPH|nr:hypothetical protein FHP24_07205 [Rhizobium smilacinae]